MHCIQVKFVELILPVAKIVACRWGIGAMLSRLTLFWEETKIVALVTNNKNNDDNTKRFWFSKCFLETINRKNGSQ